MHPDSPTPPKENARGDRPSSGTPTWTTWQRLDEDLPTWDSWSTLADGPSSPPNSADGERSVGDGARSSRRPPGIKSFRLSDAPSSENFQDEGADDRARRPSDASDRAQRPSDASDRAQRPSDASDRAQRPSDASGPSSAQPTVELYNHRPLFSPDAEQPRPIPPSGDGYRSSGDGHRTSGDGVRHSGDGHRTSGDGYPSRDHAQARGDGYSDRRQARGDGYSDRAQTHGDGYSDRGQARGDSYSERSQAPGDGYSDRTQARGDGYSKRSQAPGDGYNDRGQARGDGYSERSQAPGDGYNDRNQARGDGYGDRRQEAGDGYRDRNQTHGDGYIHQNHALGDGGRRRGDEYDHPRTSPRDEYSRTSGDGYADATARGDGYGRSAGESDGPSVPGDGYSNPQPKGDGYSNPQPEGDGYSRAHTQGDGYSSTHAEGDGNANPQVEGDGHRSPRGGKVNPRSLHGDGYQTPAVEGDGFTRPADQHDGIHNPAVRGDGFDAPEVRGDGFDTLQGDGFDSRTSQEDGFDSGAVQGDGFDSGAIQEDGFDSGAIQEDGFDSSAIEGDGFDASAAKGRPGDLEPEEDLEPWNDLSDYVQVGAPSTTPAADQDAGPDEGFSALDLRDRVVIMLLFKQVVQIDAVEKAHRRWQKESGGKSKEPLWRVLTMDPAFDRDKIFAEAAQVYAFKQATLDKKEGAAFIKKHKDTFAETFWDRMTKLRVLPIRQETQAKKKEKRTIFVSHDPSRPDVNRLMRELKLDSFELQYAPEAEIDALIHEAFPKRNEYLDRVSDNEFAFDLGTSYDQSTSLIDEDALEAEISRSSLINLFEASLVEAVRRGVSDIHIFPNPRKQIEIHFRVDGELECWHREERVHPEAFLAVVKDNTLNVDRFERDTAQDGFIQRKVDDTLIRYRVSVLPVANANQEIRSESIVIRVLDDRKVITDLGRLGLLDQARAKFEWAIRQPHGMVILTGPTGSGKTTTLFAALHQVVTDKVNVLTVEDPVEYVIPGVRQIKLSHKLTLEQALRSILRHDPDIVMVGEMRDRDTAELAIKLANTGHLTFSTLHTNDAPSAVSRLYKMGVEPFLIAYAINLVVAQRLLRTLCMKCKRPAKNIDQEMLQRLGFTPQELAQARFYDEGHNPDCRACGGTGYKGRRAITETMAFTDEIRRRIVLANDMIDEDGLRQQAVAEGMLTLRGSAREIVKQGDTSVTELIRVTAGEH